MTNWPDECPARCYQRLCAEVMELAGERDEAQAAVKAVFEGKLRMARKSEESNG